MAQFTVRVEVLDSRAADYKLLQSKMKEAGFTQTIKEKNGKTYLLPHSEYNFSGDEKKKKVLERVKKAVAVLNKKCWILVTLSAGRIWDGLEEIEPVK